LSIFEQNSLSKKVLSNKKENVGKLRGYAFTLLCPRFLIKTRIAATNAIAITAANA
jgi:hypothetical protein